MMLSLTLTTSAPTLFSPPSVLVADALLLAGKHGFADVFSRCCDWLQGQLASCPSALAALEPLSQFEPLAARSRTQLMESVAKGLKAACSEAEEAASTAMGQLAVLRGQVGLGSVLGSVSCVYVCSLYNVYVLVAHRGR
jgi:hypothetical protein